MIREQIQFVEEPPPAVREAMREWLCHHGIDPDWVPMLCWIDRCEATRRITYPEIRVGIDPGSYGDRVWMRTIHEVVRTVQLEAAPSPLPKLTGARFNYACISDPRFAATLTVPPTWPPDPAAAVLDVGDGMALHGGRGAVFVVHDGR